MINNYNIYEDIQNIMNNNNIKNDKLYIELIQLYENKIFNYNNNIISDLEVNTFMITENTILKI